MTFSIEGKTPLQFWEGLYKDLRLAIRFGKSNHYRIVDIFGRHILETAQQAGPSKEIACVSLTR